MSENSPIRRALLSVSDKSGIIEFARALHERGVALLSTGGTARALADAGLPVVEVAEHTGAPEIMGGRVKTLHPKIHGGILARRGQDDQVMDEQNIAPIDLVVVNLYPFQETIAQPNCSRADAIEQIDIGGPTMLRAAAKNHRYVTVVVNHQDYATVIDELEQNDNSVSNNTRARLAADCFAHTAAYDDAVANYLGSLADDQTDNKSNKGENQSRNLFGNTFNQQWHKRQDLRYGENPHQQAAFYADNTLVPGSLASATQLQGKALSYNNIADADAALACVRSFDKAPACVIVKHANPCGVAVAQSLEQAYQRAFKTDPTSAFGGIIAFNETLNAAAAQAIVDNQFAEVIIAPHVDDDALAVFARKKNLRVLATGNWDAQDTGTKLEVKQLTGGLLVQSADSEILIEKDLKQVSERSPSDTQIEDLLFAWQVAKFVKSNAIVYAREGATIGIGAGQMSRIDSARIAGLKAEDAGLQVAGAVMASDAFFPFRDGIDAAAKAGIRAVIQPGGSIRDDEVIAAANEAEMAMLFTSMRHFRH